MLECQIAFLRGTGGVDDSAERRLSVSKSIGLYPFLLLRAVFEVR